MSISISQEWKNCILQVLSKPYRPHIIFVVGAPDVGKTTFCCALANAAVEQGLITMVVDADVGQSSIGPPTTIGLGRLKGRISHLSEAEYVAGFFVGHVSPMGHLLPTVVGTKLMTDKAISSGADIVIVDTTGLVRGAIGRELKWNKVRLIKPQSLIAIERGGELAHLLAPLKNLKWLQIHSVSVSSAAKQRDRGLRKFHRESKFRDALEGAREVELSLQDVALLGTWLGCGTPVHSSFLSHLSEVADAEIAHAERCDNIGVLVTVEKVSEDAARWIASRWGVNEVIAIQLEQINGLVLGLHNAEGEFLSIGVLLAYDGPSKKLRVLIPSSVDPKDVALVVFGKHRINPDGSEMT
ncbi:MAG: Clp1/GlmU family protein [Armatimonadota bacterium]|nr:Clp1/GlmU family protein [Armatimonadota bacterium]MCX7776707.1 Clp1/GlmU family protein [Armatimonadota bacterium]MDW8026653.1 Clp1/GlmU family protein [Armatimonadota bacterium]